ncbi:MAG: response regulator [Pyrinomonadaceae bacterium]
MLTGRKLLLADDSLTIQKVVSLTFGDEGMEVTTVGSGAAALEHLGRNPPDIVLADVFMPGPDGYQVCAHVKQDERLRHIPVVLLVGTFEPFNEAEARRVGADDVLTKPFQSIRDLVSKVGNLLGGHADEQKTDEAQVPATTDANPTQASAPAESTDASPAFPWMRPQAESAAAEPPAWSPAPATSAGSYNDFDMDDQTIQTTSAEAFGGQAQPGTAAQPFLMREIEAEREPLPDAPAPEESFDVFDEPEQPVAAVQMQPESAPEFSYAGTTGVPSEFAARAAQSAAADDALLDLGETATQSTAAVETDEFILDLDDETFSGAQPAPESPRMVYAEGLASTPAEAAAPVLTEEAPHTDTRALEADAQAYAAPAEAPSAPAWEPSFIADEPAAEAIPSFTVEETAPAASEAQTQAPAAWQGTWTPTAVEAAAPMAVETASAPTAADMEQAAPAVGSTQASAQPLAQEMIDAIARRVVELMSDSIVREIAWEVVPDLAERLIQRRLDEERPRTQ